ncbi:MAG: hypothetical protein AAF684_03930, partial [Pseudomonadota bacterium]
MFAKMRLEGGPVRRAQVFRRNHRDADVSQFAEQCAVDVLLFADQSMGGFIDRDELLAGRQTVVGQFGHALAF